MAPSSGAPAVKGFRAGTQRSIAPAETVARVSRFMPVTGITRVANVTGLDCIGVPVVMVYRPNSRSLAVAQGKGLDLDAAKASGLMESIETYHAEHITLPLKLCSLEELRYSNRVVDVYGLNRSPESLIDPYQPILWIEGHDLLGDEPVWLPYELVHANYTITHWHGTRTFLASTNGLASGNHPLEAISHAICEVVERDATTLWAVRGEETRKTTRIDLHTVDDPACRSVLDKLEQAGVATTVWETTSDIGIPTFRCSIVDRGETRLTRLYSATGMGCHPTREVALLRALTEAIQSRLTAISGSRDELYRTMYDRIQDPEVLEKHLAYARDCGSSRSFAGPSWDGETFDDDVSWELERLGAAGIERVVVVDLTRPEFGVPVVRVVIPGLEFLDDHGPYRYGERARRIMAGQG